MTIPSTTPLKSLPAPPVRSDEGMPRGRQHVDLVDAAAASRDARTSAANGWGSWPFSTPELTLPVREVRRLVLAAPRPADHGPSLPLTSMRSTRRLDLLLPVRDNDGHPFSSEDFEAFEALLLTLAGGYTNRGVFTGAWRSPSGQVFVDETRAYTVTVPSDLADSVASSLSDFIQDRFRQEAAWIESIPTFVAAA